MKFSLRILGVLVLCILFSALSFGVAFAAKSITPLSMTLTHVSSGYFEGGKSNLSAAKFNYMDLSFRGSYTDEPYDILDGFIINAPFVLKQWDGPESKAYTANRNVLSFKREYTDTAAKFADYYPYLGNDYALFSRNDDINSEKTLYNATGSVSDGNEVIDFAFKYLKTEEQLKDGYVPYLELVEKNGLITGVKGRMVRLSNIEKPLIKGTDTPKFKQFEALRVQYYADNSGTLTRANLKFDVSGTEVWGPADGTELSFTASFPTPIPLDKLYRVRVRHVNELRAPDETFWTKYEWRFNVRIEPTPLNKTQIENVIKGNNLDSTNFDAETGAPKTEAFKNAISAKISGKEIKDMKSFPMFSAPARGGYAIMKISADVEYDTLTKVQNDGSVAVLVKKDLLDGNGQYSMFKNDNVYEYSIWISEDSKMNFSKTSGTVIDPVIALNTTNPSSGGSGGGCTAAPVAGIFALLLVPFIFKKRK